MQKFTIRKIRAVLAKSGVDLSVGQNIIEQLNPKGFNGFVRLTGKQIKALEKAVTKDKLAAVYLSKRGTVSILRHDAIKLQPKNWNFLRPEVRQLAETRKQAQ